MNGFSRFHALGRAAIGPVVLLSALGCASGRPAPKDPSQTLRAYADALEAGRTEEAYSLLSDEAKREISFDAFRRMTIENPAEVKEIARALSRPASAPVISAIVAAPDGQSLLLTYESGRWKVDGSAINLYAQNTPRQAVEAFLRAFERKRYDILMRMVPDAKKAGLDAAKLKEAWEGAQKQEIERIVQAVKSALPTANFEEVGERATVPFGAVGTVQLVREHGLWKIEDFD